MVLEQVQIWKSVSQNIWKAVKYISLRLGNIQYKYSILVMNTFNYRYKALPPYKKHGTHRKSYMVIFQNIKVMESAIEIYGNMPV